MQLILVFATYFISSVHHEVFSTAVSQAPAVLHQILVGELDPSQSGQARRRHVQQILHVDCSNGMQL